MREFWLLDSEQVTDIFIEVLTVDGGVPSHTATAYSYHPLSYMAILYLCSDSSKHSYKCDVSNGGHDHEGTHQHKFTRISTES